MFLLDNKPLALDTAFTHNDIQYPANWLRLASQAERKALGITEQPDPVVVQPKVDLNVLKKQAIDNVKQTARNELSKTDWMVIRKASVVLICQSKYRWSAMLSMTGQMQLK